MKKTHAVITVTGEHYLISAERERALETASLDDMFRIDDINPYPQVKVTMVGSVLPLAEYYERYPDRKPETQSTQDFSKPVTGDEETFVLNEVMERLSAMKAFESVHRETIRPMYRKWRDAKDKQAFLVAEGATTKTGAVVQDFQSPQGGSVVFKYFAYSLIETAISRHQGKEAFLENMRWGDLLSKAQEPKHIEAFAKGLNMARAKKIAKNQNVKGIDELLERARARYAQLKQMVNEEAY